MIVRAIDVSSYQPTDLADLIRQTRAEHVVVHLYCPWEGPSSAITVEQANSARNNGCTVGGYVFCYADVDPSETVDAAIRVARQAFITFDNDNPLWLDCEEYGQDPGPTSSWLAHAVLRARSIGVPVGIYTRRQWWEEQAIGTSFSGLPLWAAQYSGAAGLDDVVLFGGWTEARAKQYATAPCDLSVFAAPDPPDPAEGYRTALYHLRDVVLAPLRSTPCPTGKRLAAMREADRIFKQFLG